MSPIFPEAEAILIMYEDRANEFETLGHSNEAYEIIKKYKIGSLKIEIIYAYNIHKIFTCTIEMFRIQRAYNCRNKTKFYYGTRRRNFKLLSNTETESNFKTEYTEILDTSNLFSAVSDLNKFGIKLSSFPVVTVIGPQSSGKTSLIEAICGKSIFPKSMGMSTMKPFYITTIRSSQTKIKVGDKELFSEKEAQDEIERVNRNELVKTVNILLESPTVYNNYLIDLPGLFVVANKNDKDLPKIFAK